MNKAKIFPARGYLQSLETNGRQELYKEWITGLPYRWIDNFVEYGLIPFLNKRGYTVGRDIPTCIAYCKEWAFCHILLSRYGSRYKKRVFDTCFHYGGNDEYEWYQHSISVEEWFQLCSNWANTDFLDSSDPGQSQVYDLSTFVWNMIDLENSATHTKWLHHMDNLNQQYDEHLGYINTSEDTGAYGGDRRTL